ncbi:uncharacterized protein LOC127799625 [Diospyros lotus]|uniref:uncharacterized protein LOC127799625 n=1 Tax=Diospyros lotus TaxID=55363 RepID=UPI00225BDE0D|nr:uncharacterized protein LOC127799625 [Diospyros lotus]
MKREGRQHGLVRSSRILPAPWNPRPDSRIVNRVDSPPTAGLFTKVSPKPTNHSKFTGKCGRPACVACHERPASKSRGKSKGTQRLRSSDVGSNHRLVTWRVVDSKPGLKLSGFSATGILDHLAGDCFLDDDEADEGCVDEVYEEPRGLASGAVEINDHGGDGDGKSRDKEEYDLGWALVCGEMDEQDGWCLVGET